MRRREFIRLGSGLLIAQGLAACGAQRLTAPEAIITGASTSLPMVPFNPNEVGPAMGAPANVSTSDTIYGVLSKLGWNPDGKASSGFDTCKGNTPFNGFLIDSLRGETPKYGIVLAINDQHFFYDNVEDPIVAAGSKIAAFYGLPYSNAC